MDLKDVVEKVNRDALEALNAFHAGHHDTAEKYLYEIEKQVVEYLRVPASPAGDVTESATSEKPDEVQKDTPAKVLGDSAQPVTPGAAAAAQQVGQSPEAEKPTQ